MGFCKSGLMGVKMKNQLHCTTDWLFENSIISSSELKPFHQKTHACCFSLSGVITHIRQELMSALSKRVFVRASDLSYLSKKNLRLTEQSYFLVVKSYPCYAFFDNVANHVFYLFFWKTIFCINPTKFIKKWKRKKKGGGVRY